MKTISILTAALYVLLAQTIVIQNKSENLFDSLEVMEGVRCFSFSKNKINLLDIDLKDHDKNLSGDLQQISLVMYNPVNGRISGDQFIHHAISLLPARYKKYIDPEGINGIEIWMKGRKKSYTEFHLFIKNEKEDEMQFIVFFYGEFTLEEIKKLKEKGKVISEDIG